MLFHKIFSTYPCPYDLGVDNEIWLIKILNCILDEIIISHYTKKYKKNKLNIKPSDSTITVFWSERRECAALGRLNGFRPSPNLGGDF